MIPVQYTRFDNLQSEIIIDRKIIICFLMCIEIWKKHMKTYATGM